MLFREPSLTSLRRDSTRIQNGRDRLPPPSLRLSLTRSLLASRNVDLCPTLPLPMDLHPDIYYSQYYRARLYCVSRNAFTSKTLGRSASFHLFLSARSFFCRLRRPGRHARCDLPKLISVVVLKRIFVARGKRDVPQRRRNDATVARERIATMLSQGESSCRNVP